MAIGTLAAIGIGLAGAGALASSSSQKKAASKAANAQTYAADQSAAVQREQLNAAQNALAPYQQRGNAAGDAINALLGLGGPSGGTQGLPTAQGAQTAPYDPHANFSPLATNKLDGPFSAPQAYPTGTYQVTQPQGNGGGNYGNAFQNYLDSTGYQFRLGEGMNALNSGYAGSGVLQSGAAVKDAVKYGQDFASNEFGNYLGYLGNQQGVGLSGASALAGVGQNYANNISAINDNRASGIGNAALIAGNNNPFANALGMVGGGLFGYGSR